MSTTRKKTKNILSRKLLCNPERKFMCIGNGERGEMPAESLSESALLIGACFWKTA